MNSTLERPKNLGEFAGKVHAFADEAIDEVRKRRRNGERDFSVECHLHRGDAKRFPFTNHRVPLNVFQDMFYDAVRWRIFWMRGVKAYADFLTIDDPIDPDMNYLGVFDQDIQDIMVYRLTSRRSTPVWRLLKRGALRRDR